MKVASVSIETLNVGLHEPFGIAAGVQEVARNLLVTVELENGTRGWGEAAPLPAFNGETQASARAALEQAKRAVIGADVRRWREVAHAIAEATRSGAARCGLEAAMLDALARASNLPLWALFGGRNEVLVTDVTIPTGTVERAAEAARRRAGEGFDTLKVKVGGVPLEHDVARLAAIRNAAPACRLTIDANASLDAHAAIALVEELARRGVSIALFEQPVTAGDWSGLATVASRAGVPIAADESVTSAKDVAEAARSGVRVVNVKPMKQGLVEAASIAVAARAAGLDLMIGGMVETRLAMSASACLAAGLGGFAWVDLDTPLFMVDEPIEGGFVQRGPRLDVSKIALGHGAMPRGR